MEDLCHFKKYFVTIAMLIYKVLTFSAPQMQSRVWQELAALFLFRQREASPLKIFFSTRLREYNILLTFKVCAFEMNMAKF